MLHVTYMNFDTTCIIIIITKCQDYSDAIVKSALQNVRLRSQAETVQSCPIFSKRRPLNSRDSIARRKPGYDDNLTDVFHARAAATCQDTRNSYSLATFKVSLKRYFINSRPN